MDLKEVYDKLEKADAVAKKLTSVLSALELEDGDDLDDKVGAVKSTLDGIKAKGGKPDEVLLKFGQMEKTVKTLEGKLQAATAAQEAERAKRLTTVKQSLLIDALTKGNAASPKDMARLLLDNVSGEDDTALVFKNGDNEVSIEEVVTAWFKENPWAVKVDPQKGGGSTGGGGAIGSLHTKGCAADICIAYQNDTDTALAETVFAAADAWGLRGQISIGYYGDRIHIDTRGYNSSW